MRSRTKGIFVSLAILSLILIGLFIYGDSHESVSQEYKFIWVPSSPMELPVLAEVDIAATQHKHRVNPESPSAFNFDAASELVDGRWKMILFGQVGNGPAQADTNTFRFLAEVRRELGDTVDIWFVRLNRPMKNGWFTTSRVFDMCGMDGRKCFDRFLILPATVYDYSDVHAYISRLSHSECIIDPRSTRINAVSIVDGNGVRHQHLGTCGGDVTAQEVVRGFRGTLGLSGTSDHISETRPGAYPLVPTAIETVTHDTKRLIKIPVVAAKRAVNNIGDQIQDWLEEHK